MELFRMAEIKLESALRRMRGMAPDKRHDVAFIDVQNQSNALNSFAKDIKLQLKD